MRPAQPTGGESPLGRHLARPRRYLEAIGLRRRPRPGWPTPNRVLWETPALRLRRFDVSGGARSLSRHPLLVIPPEVNQSFIVDFAPGQSLVRTVAAAGFRPVAALEWRSATPETAGRDIDHSIADILASIDRLGGRVHLVGLCQGGWESAVAAALRPEAVVTLTLVAAPVDFHAGEGLLKQLVQAVPMAAYRHLVCLGRRRMRGELISAGFDSFLPFERWVLKPLALWNHLDDPGWMARYRQLDDWYRSPKDLPGRAYLRAVRELFKENRLAKGRFVVLGQRVDLGRIRCPLCLVAGRRDHITPPPQLFAAEGLTGSDQVRRVLTPGGHIGTFMGRRELEAHWPGILSWLRDREGDEAEGSDFS